MALILSSTILPIYRLGSNYLEILTGEDFEQFFDNSYNSIEDEETEIGSLGIFSVGPDGLSLINSIKKTKTDKITRIKTQSGKSVLLASNQTILISKAKNNFIGLIDVNQIEVNDICVQFAGSFPNTASKFEYIDLITELLEKSSSEKLANISVSGVKEYLHSFAEDQKMVNSPNRMELSAFSSIVAENGVYDAELEYLELYTNDSPIKIGAKLIITSYLYELLGLFWKYGTYSEKGIPTFEVPNYSLARHITYISRKALDCGSIIIPSKNNNRIVTVGTEIHGLILDQIFELSGLKSTSKLPSRLFNSTWTNINAFLTSIIEDGYIECNGEIALQQLILLLSSKNIFPKIKSFEDERQRYKIILSDYDLELMENDEYEYNSSSISEDDLDRIVLVEELDLEKPITCYEINSNSPIFSGFGIILGKNNL